MTSGTWPASISLISALALALAASPATCPRAAAAQRAEAATHCAPSEPVIYACQLHDRRVISVCRAGPRISYRFGPPGHPQLTIDSTGADGRLHRGGGVGDHGGIVQDSLRFSAGGYEYIVYSGHLAPEIERGAKRFYSGVAVMRGAKEVANLKCPARGPATRFSAALPDAIADEDHDEYRGFY